MLGKKKDAQPASAGEVFAGFEEDKRKPWKIVAITAGIVTFIGVAYVGAAVWVGGSIPANTQIAGVDVSSLSRKDAQLALEKGLQDRSTKPLEVKVGSKNTSIEPRKSGLAIDYAASIRAVSDFSLNPRLVLGRIFGLGDVNPVLKTDKDKLRQALHAVSEKLLTKPLEANLQCQGKEFKPVSPAYGRELAVNNAVEHLASNWATASLPVELPASVLRPKTTDKHLEQAKTQDGANVVSGPVRVNVEGKEASLSVEEICQAASFIPTEKGLELKLDGKKLKAAVVKTLPDIQVEPKDATFAFNPDYFAKIAPTIVPSTDGREIKEEDLAKVVQVGAITKDKRTVGMNLSLKKAQFTTEDAQKAGIKELISEFDTPAPYHEVRTFNLQKGSGLVGGALIKPQGEFSLLGRLGRITIENGWKTAGVVEGKFHKFAPGGGLSQLSTTTYNAAYFAGMDLLEHTPHSEYYTRYPPGREATLWDPVMDMKWRNSTPNYVLVEAIATDSAQYVRIWGTKYWEVKDVIGPKSGFVSPKTVHSTDPGCAPSGAGTAGFTVSVHRERWREGKKHDEENWTVTYTAQDNIVCGPKPTESSPSSRPS